MKKRKTTRPLLGENDSIRDIRQKESTIVRKIVTSIVGILIALMIIFGVVFYRYVSNALQPVDASKTEMFEIEIPSGVTVQEIGTILESQNVVRDGRVFRYYAKMKNVSEFEAGFYQVSSAMTLEQVVEALAAGGKDQSSSAAKILIREGDTIDDIAGAVEEATDYTAEEFKAKVNDHNFFNLLTEAHPNLLSSAKDAVEMYDVKYLLEGYLFPATYEVGKDKTLQMLLTEMVAKTDQVMMKYYDRIDGEKKTVHEMLTMASLLEKEGSNTADRKQIAGVFYNRLAQHMMLQTDISILYALGVHKEVVTLDDLEVASPYNLYKHEGLGPGPYNSPSEDAIKAAIEPASHSYLYFLADTKTGKVYYSETYEQHLELQKQYVDEE